MSSSLSLLPLLLLLLLFAGAAGSPYFDCSQTTELRCGDETQKILFPFRLKGSPSYCGHLGLDLHCDADNTTTLLTTIDDKDYVVDGDILYNQHFIHVIDANFVGESSCPKNFTNATFDSDLFDYATDTNITVYLNCSDNFSLSSDLFNLSCLDDRSFFKLSGSTMSGYVWGECKTVAVVPANETVVESLNLMKGKDLLGAVLKQGFGLKWKIGDGWCDKCMASKGICGTRPDSPGIPACFCGYNMVSSDDGNVCVAAETGKKRSPKTIIAIVASVVGGALILCCCLLFLYTRRKKRRQSSLSSLLSRSTSSKISSKKDPELGEATYHTHIFSYDELEEATNGFNASRELGDGGFGTVYKGKLRDGRTVAVKRLYENNYRRLEQFMNEVEILSRLRHPNLVTLYGCTSRHSRELLLVYEFIPNGTLADHLHGSLASEQALPWPVRMSTAIETADALAYLHAVEPQIIHRDVKTTNILLDSGFHVKVADFGLSRLFPLDATHVSTAPQGTPGYVDPEYHQCYQLTDKSDVYSFGVVLVELISSKAAVDISRHRHEINLSNMAITKIQNGQIDQLVDPELGYQSDAEIRRTINQVAELAFRCLQSDGDMRPGIKEVLEVLKSIEGGHRAKKEVEMTEVQIVEETSLLKNVPPFSPDSVAERWPSRSTTPNTSS